MASHIRVENLDMLNAIVDHEPNDLAYVKDIKKIYRWDNDSQEWQPVDIKNKGLELNLYSLNKNAINQMTPLTKEELLERWNLIFTFFTETSPNTHYMLLCREYNYYTIFESNATMAAEYDFVSAVLGIVEELGPVYAVEPTEGAIEFWIKPQGQEEPMVFILFPYSRGVVYYA